MVEYLFESPLDAHIGLAAIAATIWLFRDVRYGAVSVAADILSVISVAFAFEFYQSFTHPVPVGSEGSRETVFVLLSVVTFGLLPLATGLGSWFFGRGVGRIIRIVYKKLS